MQLLASEIDPAFGIAAEEELHRQRGRLLQQGGRLFARLLQPSTSEAILLNRHDQRCGGFVMGSSMLAKRFLAAPERR